MGSFLMRAGATIVNSGPGIGLWKDVDADSVANLPIRSAPTTAGGTPVFGIIANFWNQPTDEPGEYLLHFSIDEANIYVDGVATDINDLPAGFNITAITVNMDWSSNTALAYSNNVTNGASVYLRFDALTEGTENHGLTGSFGFDYPSLPVSLNSVLTNGFGCRAEFGLHSQAGGSSGKVKIWLSGTYNLVGASVQNNPNNTTNPHVFQPGDTVSIVSVNPPDLTTLTSINILDSNSDIIATIPSSSFTSWTTTTLSFILPSISTPGSYTLSGVTFSGSVALGSLFILIEDGSGIYSIVLNKTSDTIYINAPSNNQTKNFKIPDPFIKTSFIP